MNRSEHGPWRRLRDALGVALIVLLGIALSASSSPAQGIEETQRASAGDWIYLAMVSVGAVILAVVILVSARRNLNAHTGLPSPVRRPRARGPLRR